MSYQPTRPFLAAEVNNTWRFPDFPPETTIADLLKPETWAHCAGRYLKQYDEVIVIPQGGPFRAHLIIMEAGKNFAKMRLLDVKLLNATEAPEAVEAPATESLPDGAPVFVKWNGPKDKFTVFRTSDKEKLRPGFAIKADADAWARTHLLAMA